MGNGHESKLKCDFPLTNLYIRLCTLETNKIHASLLRDVENRRRKNTVTRGRCRPPEGSLDGQMSKSHTKYLQTTFYAAINLLAKDYSVEQSLCWRSRIAR